MFLGIWLVQCSQVSSWNPFGLGALIYTNGFTRDAIHECEEASLGFPCEVFFGIERLFLVSECKFVDTLYGASLTIVSMVWNEFYACAYYDVVYLGLYTHSSMASWYVHDDPT